MRSLWTYQWGDRATAHYGWLRYRQLGHKDEDTSLLLADETRGSEELLKALKCFQGSLLASFTAHAAGREVAAPDHTDDFSSWKLLLPTGGFSCDPSNGVASVTVEVWNFMPRRAALLDHMFLRDSAPALRTLTAERTPTRSARKAPATVVGSKRPLCDGDGNDDTTAASCGVKVLLWLKMQM